MDGLRTFARERLGFAEIFYAGEKSNLTGIGRLRFGDVIEKAAENRVGLSFDFARKTLKRVTAGIHDGMVKDPSGLELVEKNSYELQDVLELFDEVRDEAGVALEERKTLVVGVTGWVGWRAGGWYGWVDTGIICN